jgi:hypothetical protein
MVAPRWQAGMGLCQWPDSGAAYVYIYEGLYIYCEVLCSLVSRELTHATLPEPRHGSTPHCPSGL